MFEGFRSSPLGRRIARAMLDADAWVNSSLYAGGEKLGQAYENFSSFMDRFRVTGGKKFAVELACEGLTLGLGGAILALFLAIPAFRETSDDWLKKQELAVTFLDTAGLRDADDHVEQIGIARALERAQAADLRVFLLGEAGETLLMKPMAGDISVLGKADLNGSPKAAVSGKTGFGLEALIALITERLQGQAASAGLLIRERQRNALVCAINGLESAEANLQRSLELPELVAADLRASARALEMILGRIDVETLLDEIFSSFCIGK